MRFAEYVTIAKKKWKKKECGSNVSPDTVENHMVSENSKILFVI